MARLDGWRARAFVALLGAAVTILLSLAVVAQQGAPTSGRGGTAEDQQRIEALRDQYLQTQGRAAVQPAQGRNPSAARVAQADPAAAQAAALAGCIREACDLGTAICADQTDLLRITRACNGSPSAGCARAACNRLGELGCDEVAEVVEIVSACRANQGGMCLERACHLAGSLPCEERQTVLRLARACSGNAGDGCVRVVCNQSGPMACDTVEGVSRVAQTCGAGP